MSERYRKPFGDISDIRRHFMISPASSASHSRSQSNNGTTEDCVLNLDTKSSRVESYEENSATSKEIVVEDSPRSEDRYRSSVEPADDKQAGPTSVSSEKVGSPTPVTPHPEIRYPAVLTEVRKRSCSEETVRDYSADKLNLFIAKGATDFKFPLEMPKLDYHTFHPSLTSSSPTIDLPMPHYTMYQQPYSAEHLPLYLQHSLFPFYRKGILSDSFTSSRSSSTERIVYQPRFVTNLSSQSTIATATH